MAKPATAAGATAPLPRGLAPMLATTGKLPTRDTEWAFEIKWDGVRVLAYVDGRDHRSLRLESRNRIDISSRYPELEPLPDAIAPHAAVLDGEAVVFDPAGRPSFSLLQHRMHVADPRDSRKRMADYPVTYEIFDLLWLDGEDLTALPFTERRRILDGLGLNGPDPAKQGCWQVPGYHIGDGAAMLDATRERRLEGVVAKKLDAKYEPGRRSRCWIKVKNVRGQEVVIGGWLPGEGGRAGKLGAILVGYYDGDDLRYAGRVGTGFTERTLAEMQAALEALATPASPFADRVPSRQARFARPELVAEVAFSEWTPAGTLRHPSYKGLREDKDPHEVVREPS